MTKIKLTSTTILGTLAMLAAPHTVYADETAAADAPGLRDASPQAPTAKDISADNVLNMSLADLTNLEITSVSKKAEKASEAAAAIYVITSEDIRRSGATAIPELLRMVPGINVAQSGSHDWAVTARGFNDQFSNKLLVLIDGRTVYSPLFSGVLWDAQDTLLEDIDRIEVIRGPGATQWGANAVNGVINIITKSAKDTQGTLLTASAGNEVKSIDGGRYGTHFGDTDVRAYAKYTDYGPEKAVGGGSASDDWQKRQGGFRSDSKLTESADLTLQGDVYQSHESNRYTYPTLLTPSFTGTADTDSIEGGNLLGRWTQKYDKDSTTTLQAYVDNTDRRTLFFNDYTNTFDIDFQHIWTRWTNNEIIWGAGYRYIRDENEATRQFALIPPTRNDSLYNAFLQDKIALIPDNLFLTLGSKFEHNEYSGFEVQPSARLSYLLADNQTLWGSVSRAVHTPSRFQADGTLASAAFPAFTPGANPFGLPAVYAATGGKDLDSEKLVAYELGYRIQPSKSLSFDASAFYNDYSKLFTSTFGTPGVQVDPLAGPYVLIPVVAVNGNTAHSVGFELSSKWDVNSNWQLAGGYSYLDLQFDNQEGPGFSFRGKQPKNQFNLRSTYLFPHNVEMTNALYYVSDLNGINIDSYYRFDTKVSYEVIKGMEVSLVGQNLLDPRHPEFSPFFYQNASEIGRSIYGNITWKF